ncbi:MAG: hypothetical protein ACREXY_14145 [Gammaproteobacteria bacterium]
MSVLRRRTGQVGSRQCHRELNATFQNQPPSELTPQCLEELAWLLDDEDEEFVTFLTALYDMFGLDPRAELPK